MEYIGFGVNLELDEDVTRRIDPVLRELERLKKKMREVEQAGRNMNEGDYFYNSRRRREMRDYVSSMQRLDKVLLDISNRFVRASYSANELHNAVNRMQFTGNFNRMYSDIMRTQRMLGMMGYGMSRQQKSMSDLQAYNMLNYTLKDLQDRIKLTSQALKEMEKSGDASKYPEQYALAKQSLEAFNNELNRTKSLQDKLAETHGYGLAKGIGKDVLYDKPTSAKDFISNRMMGLAMMDMAYASQMAYSSLDKTGKMMTGFGYTTQEARMKLNALTMQMQMAGMMMTQFGTTAVAIAIAGLGRLMNRYEEASNTMHARALMPEDVWRDSSTKMYDIAIDSGATMQQTGEAMALAWNVYGDNMEVVEDQTERAMFMMKVHGISAEKSIRDTNKIMKEYGVTSEQAWDMYVAGAIEARRETGKGFTGHKGVDRIMDVIEEAPNKFKKATNSLGEFNGAFETMVDNYDKGIMEEIVEGFGALGGAILAIIESNRPALESMFGMFNDMAEGIRDFMRENEKLAKIIGIIAGITLVVVALAGPVAVATAFLVRFRNVIGGVTESITALSYGGFAVLSPQAKMAKDLMNSMVVAFARLPQTIFMGVLPALYSMIRGIPGLIFQMMKVNPVMTALTAGMIAYSKNWLGFKDTVDHVVGAVKNTVETGIGAVNDVLSGKDVDFSKLDKWEKRVSDIYGIMKLLPKLSKDAWKGEGLSFDANESQLVKSLGIEGDLTAIATTINRTRKFFDGFVDGVSRGWGVIKNIYKTAWGIIEPILDGMMDRLGKVIDFFAKAFGGGENKNFIDLLKQTKDEFNETGSMAEKAGLAVGIMFSAFAGYKLAVRSIQLVISPFIALHSWIGRVISRITALQALMAGLKPPKVVPPTTVAGTFDKDGNPVYTGVPGEGDGKDKKKDKKKGVFGKMGNFLGFGGKHAKKGPIGKVFGGIGKAIGGIGKFAGLLGRGLVTLIGGGFKIALRAIPFLGYGLIAWDLFSLAFKNWDAIKEGFFNFMGWIWGKITDLGSLIGGKISEWWGKLKEGWLNVLDTWQGFLSEKWETYKGIVSEGAEMMKSILIDRWIELKDRALEVLSEKWTAFKEGVTETATNLYTTITEKWNEIKTYVIDLVTGLVGDMLTKGKEMGTNIYNGIVGGLDGIGEKIKAMIPKTVEVVVNFVKGATEGVKNFASNAWGGIKSGASSAYTSTKNFFSGAKYADGGIIKKAHIGMVGEDGPEAIIPLGKHKRSRAMELMGYTAKALGLTNTQEPTESLSKIQGRGEPSSSSGSFSFGDIVFKINVPESANGETDWRGVTRQMASNFLKEVKRLYEVEKFRGRGKNLTFEEFLEQM